MLQSSRDEGLTDYLAEIYAITRQRGGSAEEAIEQLLHRNPQVVCKVLGIADRVERLRIPPHLVTKAVKNRAKTTPALMDVAFGYYPLSFMEEAFLRNTKWPSRPLD